MRRDGRESNSFNLAVVIAAMVVGIFIGIYRFEILQLAASVFGRKVDKKPLDLSSVQETYNQIFANFDGKIDRDKLIDGASKGLVEALGDEHTDFMTHQEYDEFEKHLSGDVGVGIGVELGLRNKVPTVIRTLRGNPAIAAGIRAGDIITEVNGEKILDKSIKEITTKIKGEDGTTVKIKVIRGGEEKEFSIIRQKISNPSVELDFDGPTAILTISRFDSETGSLAKKFAQEIKEKGSSKVILDLRGNGGGYVSAAQAVASLWLPQNSVIVKQKTGDKITDETMATGGNILDGIETVVLGDEGSASASEIVIGALKSHKKARFIGVKTYGKGSVQSTFKTSRGVVKITIAKWFTPDDKNIDKQGIQPDKEVKISEEDRDSGRDPQMEEAKK